MTTAMTKPRKTAAEKALEVVTECQAILADMRKELQGIARGDKSKKLPTAAKAQQKSDCDCEMDLQEGKYVRLYCDACKEEE